MVRTKVRIKIDQRGIINEPTQLLEQLVGSNQANYKELIMAGSILTQDELKRQLHYDAHTGIFTRLSTNSKNIKIGDVAGSITENGYVVIFVSYKRYRAHRLAWLYMTGSFPKNQIDHIDGNKSNNSFSNLREATNQRNLRNRDINANNKSGFRGVSWSKHAEKWIAHAMSKGKRKNLGYFDTAEAASKAFEKFAKRNHGKFYRESSV